MVVSSRSPVRGVRPVPADTGHPILEHLDLPCCPCRLFCRVYPVAPARTREMHHPSDSAKHPDASTRRANKARHNIVGLCIIVLDRSGAQYPDEYKEQR